MTSKYFPFDSTFTGVDSNGIPQGDRGASSADWAAYVSRMFTDGYFKLLDDQLEPSISAKPMAVDIAAGSAMIKGRQYSQDETVIVSLGLSNSQPRIDRIVLRMSTEAADRKISLVVLKGTPGASPTAPEITRSASVYDLCLAQIAVGANAIQIVEDNLTDTRNDESLCGFVKILLDGRYYPDSTIPELLWVYTMYPNTLSTGQKAVIEGDTELMGIYEASRIMGSVGDIVIKSSIDIPEGYLPANGSLVSKATYADLYAMLSDLGKEVYAEHGTDPAWPTNFAGRRAGRAVVKNNTVYIVGGHSYNGSNAWYRQDVLKYALDGNEEITSYAKTTSSGLFSGLAGAAICECKGFLFAVGGGAPAATTQCLRLTLSSDTWATQTVMAATYIDSLLVSVGDYIILLGGRKAGTLTTEVKFASVSSNGDLGTWSATNALPATDIKSTVVYNNTIYVLGYTAIYKGVVVNGAVTWTTLTGRVPSVNLENAVLKDNLLITLGYYGEVYTSLINPSTGDVPLLVTSGKTDPGYMTGGGLKQIENPAVWISGEYVYRYSGGYSWGNTYAAPRISRVKINPDNSVGDYETSLIYKYHPNFILPNVASLPPHMYIFVKY